MLDYKYKTFIMLSKIGNYTKTAEYLHLTQPAVSQHIKALESIYNTKLLKYEGKSVKLTEKGKFLYDYVSRMMADALHIEKALIESDNAIKKVAFGATNSIGPFIMPDILKKILPNNSNIQFYMEVDNTSILLEKLRFGEIDFAFVEGFFDKAEYDFELLSKEEFIPVCGSDCELSNGERTLEELVNYRLLLREKGSGTRDILEQFLTKYNLNVSSFKNICEINNFRVIKELLKSNTGISFLYKVVINDEISQGTIKQIKLKDIKVIREFNFVCLKNSVHKKEYLNWFKQFYKAKMSL